MVVKCGKYFLLFKKAPLFHFFFLGGGKDQGIVGCTPTKVPVLEIPTVYKPYIVSIYGL